MQFNIKEIIVVGEYEFDLYYNDKLVIKRFDIAIVFLF